MKLIFTIFILFLCGCSMNQSLLISSNALLAADWMQTSKVARHPNEYHENNILLGRHPSTGAVNTYFASAILLNTAIYPVMPKKLRPWWYGGLTLFEAAVVSHNLSIGIGF